MATAYSVDDTDSKIEYSGSWMQQINETSVYNQTLHWTSTPGSSASYSFEGTSVSVFGTITPSGGSMFSTYFLDGKPVGTFSVNHPNTTSNYPPFFQSANLTSGSHTLKIIFNGSLPDIATSSSVPSASQPTPIFWLDYLVVNGAVPSEPVIAKSSHKPIDVIVALSLLGALIVSGLYFSGMKYFQRKVRARQQARGHGEDTFAEMSAGGTLGTGVATNTTTGETNQVSGAQPAGPPDVRGYAWRRQVYCRDSSDHSVD